MAAGENPYLRNMVSQNPVPMQTERTENEHGDSFERRVPIPPKPQPRQYGKDAMLIINSGTNAFAKLCVDMSKGMSNVLFSPMMPEASLEDVKKAMAESESELERLLEAQKNIPEARLLKLINAISDYYWQKIFNSNVTPQESAKASIDLMHILNSMQGALDFARQNRKKSVYSSGLEQIHQALESKHVSRESIVMDLMVSQARALEDFFSVVSNDQEAIPEYCAQRIIEKYSLTPGQKQQLIGVSERVSKAKHFISEVAKRFGLKGDSTIVDEPASLYKFIYRQKAPDDFFYVRLLPFAIDFLNVPPDFFDTKVMGDTDGFYSADNLLGIGPKEIASADHLYELRAIALRKNHTYSESISLDIAIDDALGLNIDRKPETVQQHELKHIIDKLLLPHAGLAVSENGTMADYEGSLSHLRNELSAELFTATSASDVRMGHGYTAIKEQLSVYGRECTADIRQIPKFVRSIIASGMHPRTLSYIVAMEDPKDLIYTLGALDSHLKNKAN